MTIDYFHRFVNFLSGIIVKRELRIWDAGGSFLTMAMPLESGYDRGEEEARQRAAIVAYLRRQLGDPYTYGAEILPGQEEAATTGDCSEYVEAAYRVSGVKGFPDGSSAQRAVCICVRAPKPGDLAFLEPNAKGIGHVMTCTGENTIIHAVGGGGVIEDPLDKWLAHPRFAGFFRYRGFACPLEERA